jgi:hypothetical protein
MADTPVPEPEPGSVSTGQPEAPAQTITPDLVMKVADRVYALLLRDLLLEQERTHRK